MTYKNDGARRAGKPLPSIVADREFRAVSCAEAYRDGDLLGLIPEGERAHLIELFANAEAKGGESFSVVSLAAPDGREVAFVKLVTAFGRALALFFPIDASSPSLMEREIGGMISSASGGVLDGLGEVLASLGENGGSFACGEAALELIARVNCMLGAKTELLPPSDGRVMKVARAPSFVLIFSSLAALISTVSPNGATVGCERSGDGVEFAFRAKLAYALPEHISVRGTSLPWRRLCRAVIPRRSSQE